MISQRTRLSRRRMIWLLLLPPLPSVSSHRRPKGRPRKRDILLTGEGEGGGGGRSQIMRRRESLVLYNILMTMHTFTGIHLQSSQLTRKTQRFCVVLAPQVKYGVRSPQFIWAPVYSCTHWMRPPAFGLMYEGAIGQIRQATSLWYPLIGAFQRGLRNTRGIMKNWIFNNETQVFFSVLKFERSVNMQFSDVFEDKTIHIMREARFFLSSKKK